MAERVRRFSSAAHRFRVIRTTGELAGAGRYLVRQRLHRRIASLPNGNRSRARLDGRSRRHGRAAPRRMQARTRPFARRDARFRQAVRMNGSDGLWTNCRHRGWQGWRTSRRDFVGEDGTHIAASLCSSAPPSGRRARWSTILMERQSQNQTAAGANRLDAVLDRL